MQILQQIYLSYFLGEFTLLPANQIFLRTWNKFIFLELFHETLFWIWDIRLWYCEIAPGRGLRRLRQARQWWTRQRSSLEHHSEVLDRKYDHAFSLLIRHQIWTKFGGHFDKVSYALCSLFLTISACRQEASRICPEPEAIIASPHNMYIPEIICICICRHHWLPVQYMNIPGK